MSRMSSIAALHRRMHHERLLIPAGGMLGWPLANSAIPENWILCDGTGGTIDPQDKYLIGKNSTHDGAGGGDLSFVSATTNSAGDHTGASNIYIRFNMEGTSAWSWNYAGASTHAYTGATGVSYDPYHYKMAFIQATKPTPMPKDAVGWLDILTDDPPDEIVKFYMPGRFIKGQTGSARGYGGSNTFGFTLTGCSTSGVHHHHPTRLRKSGDEGTAYLDYASVGGHNNHSAADSADATRPPWTCLLPVKATVDGRDAPDRLIIAYNGDLADLPRKWIEANGGNGSRDCRGRIPIAPVSGINLGSTGGDEDDHTASFTTGAGGISHSHRGSPYTGPPVGYGNHHTATNSHTHVVTARFKKLVSWHGISFIELILD